MATSKFQPREVPDQVSQEVRQYLDDTLQQISALLNPAADYIDDDTIAHTDEDETITGDWLFNGSVTFGSTVLGLSSDDLSDVASIAMLDENETITGNYTFGGAGEVDFNQDVAVNLGKYLYVWDSSNTDWSRFQHNGIDLILDAFNTTDFELSGFTGALDLRDGMDLRIRDAGDTDWVTQNHNGTDYQFLATNTVGMNWSGITGTYDFSDGTHMRLFDGMKYRAHDSSNVDYVDFYHTGILGRIDTNAGPIQFASDINLVEHNDLRLACSVGTIQSTSARVKAELQSLADDATGVFMHANNSTYRLHVLVCSYNATATCMWFQTSTQAPQVIFQGSNVSIAATVNPNVDTDVNIWHSSSTGVSIKNRMGSTRTFTLYSLGL